MDANERRDHTNAAPEITRELWACPLCARSQWLDAGSDDPPVCIMCDEDMKIIGTN